MHKEKSQQNRYFFFILFVGIIVLAYFVIKPYILLVALAFLVSALCMPMYKFFLRSLKNAAIANALTLLVIALAIILPLIFVGFLTYNQVLQFNTDVQAFLKVNNITTENTNTEPVLDAQGNVIQPTNVNDSSIGTINIDTFVKEVNKIVQKVPGGEGRELSRSQVEKFVGDFIGPATNFLADKALKLGSSSLRLLTDFIVFLVVLATMFSSHRKIIKYYKEISPLDDELDALYVRRITIVGTSMIKGTFFVGLIQGLLTGLFLAIAGVDYLVFWTLVSIVLSMIPFGSGLVSTPIGIIMLFTGNPIQGAMLILTNMFFVSQLDNFLRPKLVPKEAELPEALVLISILGGIQFFGTLGFIYGPIVIIFLTTTLEFYVKYYKDVEIKIKESPFLKKEAKLNKLAAADK